MKVRQTKNELKALIVELSIDHHGTQVAVTRRRNELNDEYSRYFRVYGDPDPNYRGIRWDDPRYKGVIEHTNEAYGRLRMAKQKRYSAKRRLETAVVRLMTLTGASFAVLDSPVAKRSILAPVRRSTSTGETLQ